MVDASLCLSVGLETLTSHTAIRESSAIVWCIRECSILPSKYRNLKYSEIEVIIYKLETIKMNNFEIVHNCNK